MGDRISGAGVLVIVVALVVLDSVPAAGEQGGAVVTIRVHDYARLSMDSLRRAQAQIARIYNDIGVDVRWRSTVQHGPTPHIEIPAVPSRDELHLIVLSPRMSRRQRVSPDIVGKAVTTAEGDGRIAYILFDRVCGVARASGTDVTYVMGMVMAHEIGHLLLSPGAHSTTGLMRPNWKFHELRRSATSDFAFTPLQGILIRGGLRGRTTVPFVTATQ